MLLALKLFYIYDFYIFFIPYHFYIYCLLLVYHFLKQENHSYYINTNYIQETSINGIYHVDSFKNILYLIIFIFSEHETLNFLLFISFILY